MLYNKYNKYLCDFVSHTIEISGGD